MSVFVAHPDDIEAIREIARVSWETDYPEILSRESVAEAVNDWYSRERIRAELEDPWTHIYVAMEDGEIVGFAHAVLAETEGNVLRMYVHPDARRQGVGQALFDRVQHELLRHDINRLNAMVLSENGVGNDFYSNLSRSHRV